MLTDELLEQLSFSQKISLISQLRNDLIAFPAHRYKQLKDLLKLCSDTSPDVVIKAVNTLCDVFEDIIPSYRIRQNFDEKENKNVKISKEVEQLRN